VRGGTLNIYFLTPGLHHIDDLSLDERYSYIAKEELGGILRQYVVNSTALIVRGWRKEQCSVESTRNVFGKARVTRS
jgi:hypothetical protein